MGTGGEPAASEGTAKKKLFGSKLLANLAPSAAFRKGKTPPAAAEYHVDSEAEAHLCQLAMMENYASHPMWVKFSDEEAEALEQRSLQLALADSKADEEAIRLGLPRKEKSGSTSIGAQPYTPSEVQNIISLLKSDDDPLFWDVAAPASRASSGAVPAPGPVGEPSTPAPSPFAQKAKVSSFAAFKRKLLPSKKPSKGLGRLFSKKVSVEADPSRVGRAEPEDMVRGHSPGTDDHFEAEAMAGSATNESMRRALADSGARQSSMPEANDAILARALEASRVQGELDEALREAKNLRLDLGDALERCRAKLQGCREQEGALEGRVARLSSKQKTPLHLRKEVAEAKHQTHEAEGRVEALEDAVEELGHLEEYVRTMQPSKNDAISLSEVITRQLLGRLNFMGFAFHVPSSPQASPAQAEPSDIDLLLAKFRELNPVREPTPTTMPPPSPAPSPAKHPPQPAASPKVSLAPQTPPQLPSKAPPFPEGGAARLETGLQEIKGSPAPSAAPSTPVQSRQPPVPASPLPTPPPSVAGSEQALPPLKSWTSVTKPLPPHRPKAGSVHPSEMSGLNGHRFANGSSVAESVASWSTASTSQRPAAKRPQGPLTVKRSSQVVHLFAEMRKIMPEAMEVTYAETEPQRPRSSKKATVSDEISEEAKEAALAEAGNQYQLLQEIAGAISGARLQNMAAVRQVVADLELRLQPIRGDPMAVMSQAPNFPKAKWRAMKDSASLSIELQDIGNRMRSWAVGQGSYSEEATVMEVYFDTVRVRMAEMQAQAKDAERRWGTAGIPWSDSAFKECRMTALHLATLFMSQALIAVADLERAQTLKAEACIQVLVTAVRIAYKVHQFVGGFHGDAVELFEKVKRLTQYYVRSRDPTWLKDTTKFTH